MIEIKNLKKDYELDDSNFTALSDINLKINDGEFVMILGQSGCGKSTLLNILGGMDVPTSGSIKVNGRDLAHQKPDQLSRYRQKDVGMIFQKFNLVNDATVLENIKMPLKFSGQSQKAQTQIAEEVLEAVDLREKANSLPKKLSGGQQQRVAIARAIVNNPKVLLCDEPTGNLDSKTGKEIINLLKKLNSEGHTIVMVTHNEAYEKYADKVVRMLDGKIISETVNKNDKSVANLDQTELKIKKMNFHSRFSMSLKNLKRRKLRFFLTSFGIAIGAMAIVILVSFGAGLQKEALDELQNYSQVEEINVTGQKTNGVSFSVGTNFAQTEKKNLNDTTIADLKKIPGVDSVYSEPNIFGRMIYKDKTSIAYGTGVTPLKYVKQSTKDEVKYGKYFTNDNENDVIIPYGQAVALGFTNPKDAIGKEVTMRDDSGKEFKTTIAGVLSQDQKTAIYTLIPTDTANNWLKQIKTDELKKADPNLYDSIVVRATSTSKVSDIKKAVDDMNYGAQSYDDIAKSMTKVFVIMQIVMGVIGGIALLVASLGIVNTMIMSVLERTKEIGIMKAVGAKNRDIKSIFVSEASLIGLFGGLLGLALGFLGSRAVQSIVNTYLVKQSASSGGDSLSFYVPAYLAIGVVVFSILIAIIAGYFPAKRAAKLDPAEALREE